MRSKWVDCKLVKAMAWDSQVAGYNTFNTVSVRLWSALPIFANDTTENHSDIITMLENKRNENSKNTSGDDPYKNIIEIRKECEKITCAPYPKVPQQSLKTQELVLK